MNVYWVLAASIIANATANILIKIAMRGASITSMGTLISRAAAEPAIWFGGLLFVASFGGYSYVLSKLNLSTAYPLMTSVGLAIVVLYSTVYLHEGMTWQKAGGFVLIIVGIWAMFRR
ncbi:MAG: hypothetical protein M0Z66_07750 [Thermaerobacter sp.]|nr:hypothetical protein [Thermaerobacter sp.]